MIWKFRVASIGTLSSQLWAAVHALKRRVSALSWLDAILWGCFAIAVISLAAIAAGRLSRDPRAAETISQLPQLLDGVRRHVEMKPGDKPRLLYARELVRWGALPPSLGGSAERKVPIAVHRWHNPVRMTVAGEQLWIDFILIPNDACRALLLEASRSPLVLGVTTSPNEAVRPRWGRDFVANACANPRYNYLRLVVGDQSATGDIVREIVRKAAVMLDGFERHPLSADGLLRSSGFVLGDERWTGQILRFGNGREAVIRLTGLNFGLCRELMSRPPEIRDLVAISAVSDDLRAKTLPVSQALVDGDCWDSSGNVSLFIGVASQTAAAARLDAAMKMIEAAANAAADLSGNRDDFGEGPVDFLLIKAAGGEVSRIRPMPSSPWLSPFSAIRLGGRLVVDFYDVPRSACISLMGKLSEIVGAVSAGTTTSDGRQRSIVDAKTTAHKSCDRGDNFVRLVIARSGRP